MQLRSAYTIITKIKILQRVKDQLLFNQRLYRRNIVSQMFD